MSILPLRFPVLEPFCRLWRVSVLDSGRSLHIQYTTQPSRGYFAQLEFLNQSLIFGLFLIAGTAIVIKLVGSEDHLRKETDRFLPVTLYFSAKHCPTPFGGPCGPAGSCLLGLHAAV